MRLSILIEGRTYHVLLNEAVDISVYQSFDGTGPRFFGGSGPTREPYTIGNFVGSVDRGGSCNVDTLHLTPHLDGTHTETVAHIRSDAPFIGDANVDTLIPAVLLTITPTVARETSESLPATRSSEDEIITRDKLEQTLAALTPLPDSFLQAVVVRTSPNDADKTTRDYDKTLPPYFSVEAIRYLADRGMQHLLVDLPSIDRPDDGGALACHHAFLGGLRDARGPRTVTEMVYVHDTVADGTYLLNLQYPRLGTDAAPSRPVLIPLQPA